MGNQQGSSEKENLQRLWQKPVHHKLLVVEMGSSLVYLVEVGKLKIESE
jgi:hypothetical protein